MFSTLSFVSMMLAATQAVDIHRHTSQQTAETSAFAQAQADLEATASQGYAPALYRSRVDLPSACDPYTANGHMQPIWCEQNGRDLPLCCELHDGSIDDAYDAAVAAAAAAAPVWRVKADPAAYCEDHPRIAYGITLQEMCSRHGVRDPECCEIVDNGSMDVAADDDGMNDGSMDDGHEAAAPVYRARAGASTNKDCPSNVEEECRDNWNPQWGMPKEISDECCEKVPSAEEESSMDDGAEEESSMDDGAGDYGTEDDGTEDYGTEDYGTEDYGTEDESSMDDGNEADTGDWRPIVPITSYCAHLVDDYCNEEYGSFFLDCCILDDGTSDVAVDATMDAPTADECQQEVEDLGFTELEEFCTMNSSDFPACCLDVVPDYDDTYEEPDYEREMLLQDAFDVLDPSGNNLLEKEEVSGFYGLLWNKTRHDLETKFTAQKEAVMEDVKAGNVDFQYFMGLANEEDGFLQDIDWSGFIAKYKRA